MIKKTTQAQFNTNFATVELNIGAGAHITKTGYRWESETAVASAADYLVAIGYDTEALYGDLATDSTMQRFVDEGFSDQRLQHVLDARFFSAISDNGLMGFDAQLAHFSDQAPTEREALYRTLNNWDEQWVPGSYWYEGCQTSLNAASNTGWDYCSPDARMAAGGLLLGVAGAFSTAAQVSRLGQSISIADDMGFGVQNTIASSGSPASIYYGAGNMTARQSAVLDNLGSYGSRTIVNKSGFGLNDLAALTASTGDEFAMFTMGGRRLIVRGSPINVPIDDVLGAQMSQVGWRWSAHTHPGASQAVLNSSVGDRLVLSQFSQSQSAILNSLGQRSLFTRAADSLGGWLPS